MNTAPLKNYAPKARRQFMEAVRDRAQRFGVYADRIEPATVTGDVLQIAGQNFPASLSRMRERLVEKVKLLGFDILVEQVAYTWFNRLCAIRFMELHGYLGHGYRVLSHPEKKTGLEILDHAQDAADSLGLDRNRVIELKLAQNQEEQLYREILLAQCHQLHRAMPFLFDALDGAAELLLPENLTRTDSLIRGLVDDIPEENWQQIEIIGWLYQFYISDKKDEVIGKVVKSEDIPAATQLFTPNWIVKYMVQNSLGRLWLQACPQSGLRPEMEYYIEPEKDDQNGDGLRITTPEEIRILDPACGFGHILVEAYNVLKEIYTERGYRSRDIPQLILEKNLYGLDIDDRAAQLAGFALMMMARRDDRRIFERKVSLNILSLQATGSVQLPRLWEGVNLSGKSQRNSSSNLFDCNQAYLNDPRYQLLQRTLGWFERSDTLGSLIAVPAEEQRALTELLNELCRLAEGGDDMQQTAAKELIPYVKQAWMLGQQYHAVIANPPYMGGKGMNGELKQFAKENYPDSMSDLFAMFIERNLDLAQKGGAVAMITMQSWMFLSSFEALRTRILDQNTILSMLHLGARAFDSIGGEVVSTTAFVLENNYRPEYRGAYIRLVDGNSEVEKISLLKTALVQGANT